MVRTGAVGVLAVASMLKAQSFVTLHGFSRLDNGTNRDGALPVSAVVVSSNMLYGTTSAGGRAGSGSLFKLNLDGSAFTNFYDFSAASLDISVSPVPLATNADGLYPDEMVLVEGALYGTASGGGNYGYGTLFRLGADGSGFTTLHTFTGDIMTPFDGAGPDSLALAGGQLYGTTLLGFEGTLYSINPDGTQYTSLFTFLGGSEGAFPRNVTPVGSVLYGTSEGGSAGSNEGGTLFSINTDGSGFTAIYNFTNATGSVPLAGVVASGDTLYGATEFGGNVGDNDAGFGTIFAIKTNGTGHVILHAFSPPSSGVIQLDNNGLEHLTNSDGAGVAAPLVLSGSTHYGTTYTGGSAGNGTIFAINTDGTGFTTLYSFSGLTFNTNRDGANPRSARLTVSGATLYGTTAGGGPAGNGTVFSISFPPKLSIVSSGTNVVVSWPVAYAGFDYSKFRLEYSTNLALPAWSAISQGPTFVVGMNTVTNPITAYPLFFRLIQ